MDEKEIPLSFLVGDMPTFKTILQLKAENPDIFNNIKSILGTFHHCRYSIVTAGVIVEGTVDQALRGKHYRRGIRCILL